MQSAVVIAGAGPVGLMLSCELRLAGIETIILERLPRPTGQSRALGLHARSVEIFNQRGLLERFQEKGRPTTEGHFAGFPIDLSKLDGQYGYALLIPQATVEEILSERALELGTGIRRGHELVGFHQDKDSVTIQVNSPVARYELECAYLVGCDGARSTVRSLAGIEFPGQDSTLCAVLGDVEMPYDSAAPFSSGLYPGGMLGVVPLGPKVVRLMCTEYGAELPSSDVPVTLDELRERILRVTGELLSFKNPRWLSRFGDATRQAADYRKGRVFLAGDAAHIHFPLGGQGMNSGIHDAVNLGWKLAGTINGWAPAGLLDTYQTERHPVARRIGVNTRAQVALMYPEQRVGPLREIFRELLEIEQVNKYFADMITGVDVRYPADIAKCDPDAHPLLGRSIPDIPLDAAQGRTSSSNVLHAARGIVLDLSDGSIRIPDLCSWMDRVDLLTAKPTPLIDAAILVVRPDGHIAWIDRDGSHIEQLVTALTTWFGGARD